MLNLDSYLNNLDLLNHCANCLAERDNLSHCKACRYIRYSGADSGFLERGSYIYIGVGVRFADFMSFSLNIQ